jgi:Na+-translocating ferredoxin:NAD+ oxidoreductase RnfG subunit
VKLLVFAIVLACVRPVAAEHVFLREADAGHAMWPKSVTTARKTLTLSESEREALGKLIGWKVTAADYPYLEVRDERGLLGVIFLLDVLGQAQPITFAVAVGTDATVHDVRVMVYRESHGDEIEHKRFHKQFYGKTLMDPLALGKDIDAISGATISSRSETFAVKKSLALYDVLRRRGERMTRTP